MKIHQLPEDLANKIAAGEVVERPASVVKELIENSIDAKSTEIKIELEEAGLTLIRVTDNGEGMSEKDSKRAFLRHATSKITFDADLFHIHSLGFRGEALASIAAVSKVTIQTSRGNDAGTKLHVQAGELVDESKGSARKGTEITVEQLFYNTPARLKYLKTIHTELSHITDLIYRYALAHPTIRFTVFHNKKSIFYAPGTGNMLQVISEIYGMKVAKNMLPIEGETIDFKMHGFIAKPEVTRSNRSYITIIVNGRYIKSAALTHAIIRAYDKLLPLHRYPIAILSLQMDPILVDVNVHPTKLEVRFSKEKELIAWIESLIQGVFQKQTLIPSIEEKQQRPEKSVQHEFSFQSFLDRKKLEDTPSLHETQLKEIVHETNPSIQDSIVTKEIDEVTDTQSTNEKKMDNFKTENKQQSRIPMIYPIGQLQGTYILGQNETGFYMIDQHAAQERIKYEFYKEKLSYPSTDNQQLLFPLTFEFTINEISFIEQYREQFTHVGLFLEPFGDKTYAVRSFPKWFPKGMEEEIIRDIVDQIIQHKQIDIGKLREEIAIMMSCKRSIKANQYLTEQDMVRLLEDLQMTKDPFTCPHGRPVIIQFTYYEIEKMFKRIM